MNNIDFKTIMNRLNNLNIIDIRDNYLYNIGHIPNAKNIPMIFLTRNPENYLNKEETYYIYCNMGINSKKTCEILSNMGYNVVNINGGYNEYKKVLLSY